MNEALDLTAEMVYDDIVPREVKVRIGPARYVLREGGGDVVAKFKNAQMRAARASTNGVVYMDGMADTESLLVSLCLYRADDEGNLRLNKKGDPDPAFLVSQEAVKKFTNKVISDLYERAKALAGLNEEEETEEALERRLASLKRKLELKRTAREMRGEEVEAKN